MLDCAAAAPRPATIRWRQEGGAWDSLPLGATLLSNGSLSVSGRGGAGVWECAVTVPDLGTLLSPPARVMVAGPVAVLTQPNSITTGIGGTAVFHCELTTGAGTTVWQKNGRPLELETRMAVLPGGALEITRVNLGDRGGYRCGARGGAVWSDQAELRLQAVGPNAAPAPPTFLLTPVPVSGLAGGAVSLTCSATGRPTPALSWLKDGRQLQAGGRFSVAGTGSLTISNLQV